MDETKHNVRRPKLDPADAKQATEKTLPGQIPVQEASDMVEPQNAEERQPDPVQAEQAVNPELQGVEPEQRKKDPAAQRAEDKNRG
jgi:hypothetical protein